MHVDTGTDVDLVSHFVGPQSGDKSILGTVSSLKQGSQQDSFLKNGLSIHKNDFFGCALLQTKGNVAQGQKNDITKSNNKTLKLIISLIPFV